jgi:hypothetical protein
MYYHGSELEMNIGDAIFPNPNGYTSSKCVSDLEDIFEKERPDDIEYSRKDCVLLCDCDDDIDNVGGNTDYIYGVDLEGGFVEASDMSWYTKASLQLSEGDIQGAKESARKYWSGDVYEGIFEYRTDEAYIVELL